MAITLSGAVAVAGCGGSARTPHRPLARAAVPTTSGSQVTTTTTKATSPTTAAPPAKTATPGPAAPTATTVAAMTPAQLAQAFEPLDRGQACPEIGSVLPSKVSGGPLLTDLGNHSVRIQGVISGPQLMVAQPANGPNAGTTLLLSSAGDETVLNGDQRSAVEQQWSRRGGLSAGITVPEQGSSAYQLACSEID